MPKKETIVPERPSILGLSFNNAQEQMSTTIGDEVTITVLAAMVVYFNE